MGANDIDISPDEKCVLQYLHSFPNDFVPEMEIARRASDKTQFLQDARWAHNALAQLLEVQIVETDGMGKYRLNGTPIRVNHSSKKFIAPQIRDILEHNERKFDLSGYAS